MNKDEKCLNNKENNWMMKEQLRKIKSFLVNKEKRTDNQHYQTKSNYSSENVNPNIEFLEKELTTLLGLKIEFTHKANNSGKMSILYKSLDQIQPVIDKLKWKPK